MPGNAAQDRSLASSRPEQTLVSLVFQIVKLHFQVWNAILSVDTISDSPLLMMEFSLTTELCLISCLELSKRFGGLESALKSLLNTSLGSRVTVMVIARK